MKSKPKTHSERANAASDRAHRAEEPGGLFTVKQAISRALHEKAARLQKQAHELTGDDAHKEKHAKHYEILEQFNWR